MAVVGSFATGGAVAGAIRGAKFHKTSTCQRVYTSGWSILTNMPDDPPDAFTSWSGIARELGVSRTTIYKLKARDDWPAATELPLSREDVERVRTWRNEALSPDPTRFDREEPQDLGESGGPQPDLGRADKQVGILLKRARLEKLKLEREITEGKYVPRDRVEGIVCGVSSLFIDALHELELSLPRRLHGLSEGAMEAELQRVFDALRERLADHAEFEVLKLHELKERTRSPKGGRPPKGRADAG